MIKFTVDILNYHEIVYLFREMNIKYNVAPTLINEQVTVTIIDIDLQKLFLFMCVINNKSINLTAL